MVISVISIILYSHYRIQVLDYLLMISKPAAYCKQWQPSAMCNDCMDFCTVLPHMYLNHQPKQTAAMVDVTPTDANYCSQKQHLLRCASTQTILEQWHQQVIKYSYPFILMSVLMGSQQEVVL